VLLATGWILGTGVLVRAMARSADEVEQLEQYKGLVFVAVTGAALMLASWLVLRRLQAELAREAAARETLLRLERHSLAGLFVSSITHDANNVATVVASALHELDRPDLDPDAREALGDATESLAKLQRLFSDLKAIGRFDSSRSLEPRELASVVEKTVGLLRGHSLVKHCRTEVVATERITLPLDPGLIDQLVINLVINAADATKGRGRIEVRVRRDGEQAVLEVHDDGPGVPPEAQPQLFRAFKTTKAHGTGLGLLSVRECASRHRGTVRYASSPLGGACFEVRLPM